jgi:SAM-dependent methyltransferase
MRTQGGIATTDLIRSAHVGENAELFASIASLYIRPGSKIADVTFGRGVFWKSVDLAALELHASDIEAGEKLANGIAVASYSAPVDCRALPYPDASFDVEVLDPPYIEGFYRRATSQRAASGSHSAFAAAYSHAGAHEPGGPKYHDAVIDLYIRAGLEARRILRPGGRLICKCMDEVSAGKQRLAHVEIVTAYESMGFHCLDLFVLVRTNKPGVSRLVEQVHARKNHSYFLVFELPRGRAKYPKSSRSVEVCDA